MIILVYNSVFNLFIHLFFLSFFTYLCYMFLTYIYVLYNNVFIGVSISGGLTVTGGFNVTGPVHQSQASQVSDRRLKTNIVPLSDPLLKITKLRGVYFKWIQDEASGLSFDEDRHVGLIAQDVQQVNHKLRRIV